MSTTKKVTKPAIQYNVINIKTGKTEFTGGIQDCADYVFNHDKLATFSIRPVKANI